jgi:hypothetical protein
VFVPWVLACDMRAACEQGRLLAGRRTSESPGKSGWPVIISAMIVPTDQTSTGQA